MKILFTTSCLEPGCDGVGDYTTLLAAECARRGHEVALLALNDPFVSAVTVVDGSLRLPATLSWPARVHEAQRWLGAFAPEWVSVQFVCFGFHPRGLAGPLARDFGALCAGRAAHVFLHELWLGDEAGASLRHRALGWLQRRGVLKVLRAVSPRVIHTSTDAYVQRLARHGVAARELPLFGHVPLPAPAPRRADGGLTFVLFGTLHPVWPPEPLLGRLLKLGRPITLRHVGRIGAGADLWREMERAHAGAIAFEQLGPLSPEEIAAAFAAADFGIATTPWAVIGKSGSVAAMLDCGLPVIVNRDDIHFPGLTAPAAPHPLLIRMTDDLPAQLLAARRQPPRLRLPEIADRFLADLTA